MEREEIKRELLNNDTEQKFITLTSQFISLVTILIRKGIVTEKDFNDLLELTDDRINALNEKVIDEIMEIIKKDGK